MLIGAPLERRRVYLDPHRDHLTGVIFAVSAAGVQRDALIHSDWRQDATWGAVWESRVTIDSEGWTAELRIPFSQLRFQTGVSQTWGVNVTRHIQRKNETVWLQLVPRNQPWLASRMAHLVGLDGVEPRAHFELLPYVTARSEFIAPNTGNPFNDGSETFGGAGLDVKWAPISNTTITATFNPDFGQVEADPSVVNLTAFETSFEERRPFFLEGSQMFRSVAGTSIFYSRRIGRSPQGRPRGTFVDLPRATTILGAGKLTAKFARGWSIGVLNAVTGAEDARVARQTQIDLEQVEPPTNYFASRVLKEAGFGGAGAFATMVHRQLRSDSLRSRLAAQAYMFGSDAYLWLDGRRNWMLSGEAAASSVHGSIAAMTAQQRSSRRYYQRVDATHVTLDPLATSLSGWRGRAKLDRTSGAVRITAAIAAVSPGFEANDLGFHTRADSANAEIEGSWSGYAPTRWLRDRTVAVEKAWRWNFSGERQTDSWSVSGAVTFSNYWYANGSIAIDHQTFDDRLTRGGPITVVPASRGTSMRVGTDQRRAITFDAGGYYQWDEAGGWNGIADLYVSFKPVSTLSVSSGPVYTRGLTIAQYVDSVADATATRTFGARYVFAELHQTQLSLTTRADLSLTPRISAQVYLEPFRAEGRYEGLKELAAPSTYDFVKYGVQDRTLTFDPTAQHYRVDPDGAGPAPEYDVSNPDFNFASLIGKAVFRWEWRPGSTLYLVWSQQRYDDAMPGDVTLGRRTPSFSKPPSDDVFMVKASYWFGR